MKISKFAVLKSKLCILQKNNKNKNKKENLGKSLQYKIGNSEYIKTLHKLGKIGKLARV